MSRIQLLNFLIQKYKYKSYLEIGCFYNECFKQIHCSKKIGVDPERGGTHRMTSDQFFAQNKDNFDIVFIDGLHWSEQVYRDITNSLKFLSPRGTIVLHDCNPPDEPHATYPQPPTQQSWNGDVWKAIVHFRQDPNLDIVVGDFDWGCGIIRKLPNTDLLKINKPYKELTYQDLVQNRKKWLRLMTIYELKQWLIQGDKKLIKTK